MINKIENALIERLSKGLGKLVYAVKGYAGELEDAQLGNFRLPLVLVSYGGSRFEATGSSSQGKRYLSRDTFAVVVVVRNLRNGLAGRQGGVHQLEVGANQLVNAVNYLLINQTLDGLVKPLVPLRVQTIFNNAEVRAERLSAYSLEFEVCYSVNALEDGRYPEITEDTTHPDYLFNHYQGHLSEADPDLVVVGNVYDPINQAKIGVLVDTTQEVINES